MNNATFKNSSLSPSQQQLNNLIEHFKNGRLDEAERLAASITKQFPKHQFTWKILGVILGQIGRKAEALNANQKAVTLDPQDALAHNNLGTTLKELGKLEEAEASYRQAIVFKSDYALAHNNLGSTLKELGKLEEAEASYRQAIVLKSDHAEAHSNLGKLLLKMGQHQEGLDEQIIGEGVINFDLKNGLSL
jgi:Flp pilus assembly protein TadD